jgi:hypothetical protein
MAPIVLVHGIRANVNWFPENGFTGPLQAARVPYAFAEEPGENGMVGGPIESTGERLKAVIPALAKEFGATKVHIVAHSKGGLWSRYFFQYPSPYSINFFDPLTGNEFGVLSLITLDTPHRGSILADAFNGAIDSRVLQWLVGLFVDVDGLLASLSRDAAEVGDLSLDAVATFNRRYSMLPPMFRDTDGTAYGTEYRAVAADADIGDKTFLGIRYLDAFDLGGLPFLPSGPSRVAVANVLYRLVGAQTVYEAIRNNGVIRLPPFGVPFQFDLNDIVVTQTSAQGPDAFSPFIQILDPLRKNHSTVGDASVAGSASPLTGVLGEIRRIQPVQ